MALLISLCLVLLVLAFLGFRPQSRALVAALSASDDANRNPRAVNSAPLELPLVRPTIEIFKSKRELKLYSAGKVVRLFPIGLGSNPNDDKQTQGDGCTPEGEFYVCSKNANSNYYLSLGLSYPNVEDAERGFRHRLISQQERDQIARAISAGACPPWNTKLGGEIFIHGQGSSSDWTLGCIALDDGNIKELFDVLERGTRVTIKP